MTSFESPIALSDIESVLAWVDTFKLSRPTKKISRDFSDAVLLAEMLCVHYPKLVEMHNYPPRNSHSLKLNNWMTLNRKVLKKLKLNLCCNTMEQLANCAPGVIERVLVMVRDKIRRDEEANKGKDSEQNLSSGGSYYEALGDDEHVLVVPVKTRINGILETLQQKVVNYESYLALKEELKDSKESSEVLKQKVEHLDSLIQLKEERIYELQKQLERKQVRRKEVEAMQNSLAVPFETVNSPRYEDLEYPVVKVSSVKYIEQVKDETKVIEEDDNPVIKLRSKSIERVKIESKVKEESKIPIKQDSTVKVVSKPSVLQPDIQDHLVTKKIISKPSITSSDVQDNLERINSNVFQDIEIVDERSFVQDVEDFKDSQELTTIEDTIQNEINMISIPMGFAENMDC